MCILCNLQLKRCRVAVTFTKCRKVKTFTTSWFLKLHGHITHVILRLQTKRSVIQLPDFDQNDIYIYRHSKSHVIGFETSQHLLLRPSESTWQRMAVPAVLSTQMNLLQLHERSRGGWPAAWPGWVMLLWILLLADQAATSSCLHWTFLFRLTAAFIARLLSCLDPESSWLYIWFSMILFK
jgi:hypothetical protein